MNGIKAIQTALEQTKKDVEWFLSDVSDADLFVRPIPNANHMAWQLGNIIAGDIFFVKAVVPTAKFPELPAGFMEQHGTAGAKDDGPKGFLTKDGYLKLFSEVRAETIRALNTLTDADLDREPDDNMKAFCGNFGSVFIMASNHTWMHLGQFSVIRRKLGKPNLM